MGSLFTAQIRGLFSTVEQPSGAHLWLGERQPYLRMKYLLVFFQYSLNTRYYQAVRMESFSALFGMKTETSTACSVTLDADQALYVNNGK